MHRQPVTDTVSVTDTYGFNNGIEYRSFCAAFYGIHSYTRNIIVVIVVTIRNAVTRFYFRGCFGEETAGPEGSRLWWGSRGGAASLLPTS